MNQYKQRYELKNMAKDLLEGRYGSAVLICFLGSLISMGFTLLVNSFIPVSQLTVLNYVGLGITSLIFSTLLGVLDLGIMLFFLKMACGKSYSVNDLLYGYQYDFKRTLYISGARSLVAALCSLPSRYLIDAFLYLQNTALLAAAVIALAIGIAIYLYAGLAMALSFFLMLDFPDKSAVEILQLCFRLIRGNRKKLFCLQLSFYPLELLSACTLFIGNLWLTPYMNMTYACFYLDLMNPKKRAG